jgi:mannose-6-phosphate isomerase-like protein (cupin superfamily)
VHHEDDAAWRILKGTLRFRFPDRAVEASAGSTITIPAGMPHTYEAVAEARYVLVLTPTLAPSPL